MKKFLLGSIALVALAGSPTMAADMAVKAPVYKAPPPVYVYSWTGCYVGGNVGYGRGNADMSVTPGPEWAANGPNTRIEGAFFQSDLTRGFNSNGFTGGVQVGCNYQVGAVVVGFEADANVLRVRSSFNQGPFADPSGFPGLLFSASQSAQANNLFTFRPRIGVAFDRVLPYVTGGLAVSDFNVCETLTGTFTAGGGAPNGLWSGCSSTTRTGWTLGGGVEYAFMGPWTAKVEYLHVDLGRPQFTTQSLFGDGRLYTLSHSVRFTEDVVRVGLNYKFGWGAVVASY